MSKTLAVQSADGILALRGPNQNLWSVSNATLPRYTPVTGVPVNGITGFITSAIVQNPFGSPGSLLYINQGTVTNAQWAAIA